MVTIDLLLNKQKLTKGIIVNHWKWSRTLNFERFLGRKIHKLKHE